MMKYDNQYKRHKKEMTGRIPTGKEPLQALFRNLEKSIYQADGKGETRSTCDGTLIRTGGNAFCIGEKVSRCRKGMGMAMGFSRDAIVHRLDQRRD